MSRPSAPRRRASALPVLLASLAAAAAFLALLVARTEPSAERNAARAAGAAGVESLELVWPVGARRAYALEVDSRVHMRQGGALSAPEELRLSGELALHVAAADGDAVELGLQLVDLCYELSGRADPEAAARLSLPFGAALGRDGRPREFRFAAALGAEEREQLAELVRAFALVIPRACGTDWTTREEHALGLFEARYSAHAGGKVQKQKLRYLSPSAAVAALERGEVAVLRSEVEARVGGQGPWVEGVRVAEETRVTSGQDMQVTASMHARLEALARPPAEDLALFSARIGEGGVVGVPGSSDARQAVLSAEPGEAERAALRELVARLDAGDQRLGLVQEIAALLVRFPALAALVPEMLDEEALRDKTIARLLLALELAAVPPAQAALCAVSDDPRRSALNRLRAVVALGGVSTPSAEAIEHLWGLWAERTTPADVELADSAVLGLGRLAAALRASDAQRYAALRSRLVSALDAAHDPARAIVALKALANAADPELVDAVAGHLDSDQASVRKAAAAALGGLDREDTRALLSERFTSEADPWARAALAASLTRLGNAPRAALETARERAGAETDPTARLAMVVLLGKSVDTYPQARSTLAGILASEKDRRIRAAAAEGLARLQELGSTRAERVLGR